MIIKTAPMGDYGTNCYIVEKNGFSLIIDPGVESLSWISENAINPIAILNTHGHFDHVWSNNKVSERFNIPIYTPKNDVFMLLNDPFGFGMEPSKADFEVKPDSVVKIGDFKVSFMHFPGHTPGCSMIMIDNVIFSGDFVFKGSIGRWDFPFSDAKQMRESIKKFMKIDGDFDLYPGHGEKTTLKREQNNIIKWLDVVK